MAFIILIVLLVIIMKIRSMNLVIKWPTFFKKGFLVYQHAYGVYCYCGKQGSGKTYSVIDFLNEHKDYNIYANVKSLKGIKYTYISSFNDLLELQRYLDDKKIDNVIIFYDEIFTALSKNDKLNKDVLSFLSQMRKRKIIFLTTAQEWLEINITLRRYVRYQINCSIKNLFGNSFLFKEFNDGEQLHWSKDDNDYIAPLLCYEIQKMNLCIADSYDTFETIESSQDRNTKKLSKVLLANADCPQHSEQDLSNYTI